jgi:hypothetical protein
MNTKVAELTVDELRQLIREEVQNTLFKLLADPDSDLELRDEIKTKLSQSLKTVTAGGQQLVSGPTVAAKLGLEW